MKTTLCIAVLVAILAVVASENCRDERDCQHVTCPENDYTLDCVRGECTCSHTTATCVSPSDCKADDCRRDWHCIDGRCRCGFGFPTGGK